MRPLSLIYPASIGLLLLAGTASAHCSAETSARKQTYAALRKVSHSMDKLPPCEGHRRFAEATGRFAPPRTCPMAYAFFAAIDLNQNELVPVCEDFRQNLEAILSRDASCLDPGQRQRAEAVLQTYRIKLEDAFSSSPPPEPCDSMNNCDADKGRLSGEYLRSECLMGMEIALEVRARHAGYLAQHFARANQVETRACAAPPPRVGIDE